jgi:hypothetical protein
MNAFFLSLEFRQSQADPNLYLFSNGIMMLLYLSDISILYQKDATKAVIKVTGRLSEKYKFTNHGLARQFIGIEIHAEANRTSTGISRCQTAIITTIVKPFNLWNAHDVSSPMGPNLMIDFAEDREEKELTNIKRFQAIVGSLMYASLATQPEITFGVIEHC